MNPSTKCFVLILCIMYAGLAESSVTYAEPSLRPAAQPDEETEAEILLNFLRSWVGLDELGDPSVEEFSMGDFTMVHLASDAFWQDTATGDLEDEIVFGGEWVAPVLHEEEVVGAAVVRGGGSYQFFSAETQAFGEALADLSSSDKLLFIMSDDAWYVVASGVVTAFEEDAEYLLPSPVSLADFQELCHAQWLVGSNDPPGYLRGSGRQVAISPGEGAQSWRDVGLMADSLFVPVVAGLLLGALLAVVLARRWASRDHMTRS